jgi:ribosome biogenesis GTPase
VSSRARIVEEQRGKYRITDYDGWVEVSGRFRHEAASAADFPAVGDWVRVRDGIIEERFERTSLISRRAPDGGQQVIAANVDTVFVVVSLAHDRNARRVERYVTMVWDAGATPVVLLNKADLVEDASADADDLRARLGLVDVHAITAIDDAEAGLNACATYLIPGKTVALVGPSGVGKSTIVNRLLGRDAQKTAAVRDGDSKGRHTTTARQLVELPGGAFLIDTPGLRELQLWVDESSVDATFDDIAQLAESCRFTDCAHESEPGCAVVDAVQRGALARDRLESFRRLQREAAFEDRKHDKAAAAEHKRRWKQVHQAQKALYRDRDRS